MGKATLVLGILLGLFGCDPDVAQIGPAQYAITNCRGATDCYDVARETCPYGYETLGTNSRTTAIVANTYGATTIATPVVRDEMTVKCSAPVFCDAAPCSYGYTCTASKRYPGHNVCAA